MGNEQPLQSEVVGYWPDGSVRWCLFDMQVNLPAAEPGYRIEVGEEVQAPFSMSNSKNVGNGCELIVTEYWDETVPNADSMTESATRNGQLREEETHTLRVNDTTPESSYNNYQWLLFVLHHRLTKKYTPI